MSWNRGRKVRNFLTVFIICGVFLFVSSAKNALAVQATSTYTKLYNGTLQASEWNGLFSDFVNTWSAASMTGPLGIGTANPYTKLQLKGADAGVSSSVSGIFAIGTGDGSNSAHLMFGMDTSPATAYGWISAVKNASTWANIVLAPAPGLGNVGIGSTNPSIKLTVNGGTGNALNLVGGYVNGLNSTPLNDDQAVPLGYLRGNYAPIGTGSGSAFVQGGNLFGVVGNLGTNDNFGLNFRTNSTTKMTLDAGGDLGIGVTNPVFKLDVSGSIGSSANSITGYIDTGRNVTPWDQTFEENINGWTTINNTSVTQSAAQEYEGANSFRLKRNDTGGSGGAQFILGTQLMPGRNYTLSGYYKMVNGGGTANIKLNSNGSTAYTNGTSYTDKVLINAANWTFFSVTMTAATITGGNNNYVWVGGGMPDAVQEIYFDNLVFSEGSLPAINYSNIRTNFSGANTFFGGNVGIGLSVPNTLFSVNTGYTLNVLDPLITAQNGVTTIAGMYGVKDGASTQYGLAFKTYKSGTGLAEMMRIDNAGNVAIGTTTSAVKLTVNGGAGNSLNMSGGQIYGLNSTPVNSDQAVPLGYLQNNYAPFSIGQATGSAFIQNGNNFGAIASIGTNDNFNLNFETNNLTRLTLDTAGNIGIGTTNPGLSLEVSKITPSASLFNGIEISNKFSNSTGTGVGIYFTPNSVGGQIRSASIQSFQDVSGNFADLRFITAPGNAAQERMRITSAGNVGIGTTAPAEKLDVAGNINVQNSVLTAWGTSSTPAYTFRGGQNTTGMYLPSANQLAFSTGATEKMRIDGSGNVGIGTTVPNVKLAFASSTVNAINVAGGFVSGLNSTPINSDQAVPLGYLTSNFAPIGSGVGSAFVQGGNLFGAIANLGTNDNFNLNFRTNSATRMTVDTAGNVGIGKTNPKDKLSIEDKINTPVLSITGKVNDDSVTPTLLLLEGDQTDSSNNNGFFLSYLGLSNRLAIGKNNGSEYISVLRDSGSVGIGTTSPSTKFQVYGDGTYSASFMSGSVGIGTITPQAPLQVFGSGKLATFGDTVNNTKYITIRDSVTNGLMFGNTSAALGGIDGVALIRAGANKGFAISVNNSTDFPSVSTADFVINALSKNVGIGTTNPAIKLTVNGGTGDAVNVAGGSIDGLNSTPVNNDQAVPLGYLTSNFAPIGSGVGSAYVQGGNTFGSIANLGTKDNFNLNFNTNNLTRLTLDTSGNVGIGTTAPLNKLDVEGTNGGSAGIYLNNAIPSSNTNTLYNSNGNLLWNGTNLSNNVTQQATAANEITTTSTTDTQATNMVVTPGAGNYTVWFSSSVKDSGGDTYVYASIYVNGVKVTHSERIVFEEGSIPATYIPIATQAYLANVNAGDVIEARWRVSAGTGYMNSRTLTIQGASSMGQPVLPAGTIGQTLRYGSSWESTSNLYNNGTNIGIGTTSPAALLNISNSSTSGNQLMITSLAGNSAQSGIVFRTPFSGTNYDGSIVSTFYNNLGMIFTTPRDILGRGFAFNSNSGATRMFVDASNGNVGIGTTLPNVKLAFASSTVNTINVAGGYVSGLNSTPVNSDQAVPLGYLNSNFAPLGSGVGSAFIQGGNTFGGVANLGTNDNFNLNFETNSTTRMTVDTAGNVGIGTTAPTDPLTVVGKVRSTTGFTLSGVGNWEGDGLNMNFKTNADIEFSPGSGTGIKMLVNSIGNVGIGTTNPIVKQSIFGSPATATIGTENILLLQRPTQNGVSYGGAASFAVGKWVSDATPSSRLDINLLSTSDVPQTNSILPNVTVMSLLSSGNVGVGTTNPAIKLTVNGGTSDVINVAGGSIGGLNSTPVNSDQAVPLGYLTSNYAPIGSGVGSAYVQGGNTFGAIANLGTNDNFNLNFKTNSATRMTVDTAGNVGIGTTSPLTSLSIENSDYKQLSLHRNGSNQILWSGSVWDSIGSFTMNNAYYSSSWNFIPNYTAASGQEYIFDGSYRIVADSGLTPGVAYLPTTRLNITSTGNVSIPTGTLTVSGAGSSSFVGNVGIGTATTGNNRLRIARDLGSNDATASQHDWQLEIRRASDNKALAIGILDNGVGVIQAKEVGVGYQNIALQPVTGSVGIGTTAPNVKLAFASSTVNTINVAGGFINGLNSTPINSDQAVPLGYLNSNFAPLGSGVGSAFVQGGNTFGAIANLGTKDNYNLNFNTNSSTRMTLSATGYLGIGITAPTSVLHVTGTQPTTAVSGNGVAGVSVLNVTGIIGGNTTDIGTRVGGAGSAITIASGVGGQATAADLLSTGGAGGTLNLTGGIGGGAGVAGTGNNTGGAGGAFNWVAGTGGSAVGNTTGTNQGGTGGGITLTSGTGGTATTGTGLLNGGNGGALTLRAGAGGIGTTAGGSGGLLSLVGGTAAVAPGSAGGGVTVSAANGSSNTTGGNGGALTLSAGAAGGDNTINRAGGGIAMTAGASRGASNGGGWSFTGGAAGQNLLTGTTTGANGGTISFSMGAGGTAPLADIASIGGNGGTYSITGGVGGAAAVAGTGDNKGGNGSAFSWISGAGGPASGDTIGNNIGGNGGGITIRPGTGGAATNPNLSPGLITGGTGGTLTLSGGIGGAGTVTAGNGGPISFQTASTTALAERMRITSNGSVGLGTGSPAEKVSILSDSRYALYLQRNDTTVGNENFIRFTNSTTASYYGAYLGSIRVSAAASHLVFGTSASGAGGVDSTMERMRISNTGLVSIGTTTATSMLTINGGTGDSLDMLGGSIHGLNSTPINPDQAVPLGYLNANFAPIGSGAGSAFVQGGNSYGAIATLGTKDNYNLNFNTNSSTKMTLTTAGYLGIGITNPGYRFSLGSPVADTNDSKIAIFENAGAGNYFYGLGLTGAGANAGLGFWGGTESSAPSSTNVSLFIKRNGGNVGIGTTNPIAKLAIQGTGSDLLNIFDNSAVEKFTVLNSGYVGIGVSNPSALLEVRGQIIGGFGAVSTAGTLDWNDISNARSGSGYSMLRGNATNGPIVAGNSYYQPFNFEYSTKDGSGNLTQLAVPYGNSSSIDTGIYMRGRFSSSWTNWVKIISENTGGSVGIGTTNATIKLSVNNGTGDVINVAGGSIGGLNSTPINNDQAVPLGYLNANFAPIGSGAGSAFVQGGNPFGSIAKLGTTDNFNLNFLTNNVSKMTIDTAGNVGIGTTAPTAKFNLNGGMVLKHSTVADTNYTLQPDDYIIGYSTLSADRTVTVPNSVCSPGRFFVIVDESGNASAAAKIIIDPEGTTPIVGQQSFFLASPFNSVYIFCGNSAWYVL